MTVPRYLRAINKEAGKPRKFIFIPDIMPSSSESEKESEHDILPLFIAGPICLSHHINLQCHPKAV